MLIDFSKCELSLKTYAGMQKKVGIIYKGEKWMLKRELDKYNRKSLVPVTEYLSSKIFNEFGMEVQDVLLGTWRGEIVVAVRDFTSDKRKLVEFWTTGGNSTYSETPKSLGNRKNQEFYNFTDIEKLIMVNKKLTEKENLLERFWRMFMVDAIIGNFDRHGFNWGYLRDEVTDSYSLAPVYDNGSSLYPRLKEEELDDASNNVDEISKRIYGYPRSVIYHMGEKAYYHEIIKLSPTEECREAVAWMRRNFNPDKIKRIIQTCDAISEKRKAFLIGTIILRYYVFFEGFEL